MGPLGTPSHLEGLKKVAVVGGGVGCAIAYPIAKKLHELGAEVHTVVGLPQQGPGHSGRGIQGGFEPCGDDDRRRQLGRKGPCDRTRWKQLIKEGNQYDEVIAIGPLIMMKFVCQLTKKYGIKTMVSMNPIMIDGTGMCGGCRLTVGGKTKFACVDGPDFDGHEVDFDEAMHRGGMYRDFEAHAREAGMQPVEKGGRMMMPNMDPKKCPMPVQDPDVRNKNFDEVALGYTYEMAVNEAKRCLHCKNKPCRVRLPGGHRHSRPLSPKWPKRIWRAPIEILSASSALPAVCGRVCPQENQCEGKCVRGIKGEPVGIGRLERFVADWHREHCTEQAVQKPASNGHKVAVIGSGPAGLTGCGRPGQDGLRGHRIRGPAHARRRAGVRHSGVPSAQGYRAPGDRRPEGAGRGCGDQCGHRHAR